MEEETRKGYKEKIKYYEKLTSKDRLSTYKNIREILYELSLVLQSWYLFVAPVEQASEFTEKELAELRDCLKETVLLLFRGMEKALDYETVKKGFVELEKDASLYEPRPELYGAPPPRFKLPNSPVRKDEGKIYG